MPETDIRTLVTIETDSKGVQTAKQALKEVVKAQADLIGEFKAGGKSVEDFNKEMAELTKQEKTLESAIDKATGEITAQRKEMAAAAEEASRLAKEQAELAREQAELGTAQGRFDKVSQNVALAGDAEGSLRTISGAIGVGGGELGAKAEQAINVLSEGFAVLEAAPKLKESLSGLKGVAESAAQSLGTNVATMGALGVATVALGVALQFGQRAAEESRKAQQSQIDALNTYTETLGESKRLTSEEIEAQLEEVRARKETVSTLHEQNKAIVSHLENSGALVRVLGEASAALGQGNQAFATARDNVQAVAGEMSGLNAEEKALVEALQSAEVATNDAAEAERQLAAERTQGILAASQQAGELTRAQQQTRGATQEQLDSLAQTEKDRIEDIKEQLAVLEEQNDGSEAVAQSIERLNSQLDTAQQKLKIFEGAVGLSAVDDAVEGIKKSAKSRVDGLRAELKLLEESGDTSERTRDRIAELRKEIAAAGDSATEAAVNFATSAKEMSDAGEDSKKKKSSSFGIMVDPATRAFLKSNADKFFGRTPSPASTPGSTSPSSSSNAVRDALNKQVELNNALAKARQQTVNRLEDLKFSLRDSLDDAFEEGNFLGIADIVKNAKRQERDILRDDDRRLTEIRDDANQKLLQSVQSTNAQRLALEAQGQQALLNQSQSFWQKMANQAQSLTGRSVFVNATRTS